MIRIKNIAKENRRYRSGDRYNLLSSRGGHVKLLLGRTAAIDYRTFELNRSRIAMPGEEWSSKTIFAVIGGVEEILKRENTGAIAEDNIANIGEKIIGKEPEVIIPDSATDPAEELDATEATDVADIETTEDPEIDDEAEEQIIDKTDPLPDPPETITVDDNLERVTSEYTREQLEGMSHKALDAILEKMGKEAPPRSNKIKKADLIIG